MPQTFGDPTRRSLHTAISEGRLLAAQELEALKMVTSHTQLPMLVHNKRTAAYSSKRPQVDRPTQHQASEGYRQRVSKELEVRHEQLGDDSAFLGDAPDWLRLHGSTAIPPRALLTMLLT